MEKIRGTLAGSFYASFSLEVRVKKIDVIIPVYKPGRDFLALIDRLEHQTAAVHKIIIMNTERKYFARLEGEGSFLKEYSNICVHHLAKKDFDHGRTRRQGVEYSDAPVFVMMTMDAMPVDEYMIEKLTAPLEREDVAVSYGRQTAGKDSGEIERFTRRFNYPAKGCEKSSEDMERLGIKTFFCSNVCAAYRRDIYDRLGGFIDHTIFNEDMIYAAGAIKAGYKIVYEAGAKVEHCHNYTYRQQFHRNFDLGVSQADHPEVFGAVSSDGEGAALMKKTTAYLWKNKKKRLIPGLYISSCFKYAGYLLGKHYKCLPKKLVLQCTMSKEYWRQK